MHLLRFGLPALLLVSGCADALAPPRVGAAQSSKARPDASQSAAKVARDAADDDDDESTVRGAGPRLARLPFQVEPPDEKAAAAELDRLRGGGTLKWNWVPPGQDARWGHAEALVQAPLDVVRAQATDFAHLREMAPGKFKTSRVVDRHRGMTDVYLQIPVLHGMVTLWQVVRFAPVQVLAPGFEVVQGGLVKGNVKRMSIVVSMRAVDAGRSVVACDIHMEPEFFAPQSAIDEELRDAAGDAVNAVKTRAEQNPRPAAVASPGAGAAPGGA
jgi:hypothetical protein